MPYIVGDGEVHDSGRDDKSEDTDVANVTSVPTEVLGGGLAHADPLLDGGILLEVTTHYEYMYVLRRVRERDGVS